MDLNEFFLEVAASYDRMSGVGAPTQVMIRAANKLLSEHAPGGFIVRGRAGQAKATFTPMVAFLNPDETISTQRGIYVVYIFSQDLRVLALTLNHGMEDLRKEFGDSEARHRLANDAAAIRGGLPAAQLLDFSQEVELRSAGPRQKAYQAGNIACRMYAIADLPSEGGLRKDLAVILALYDHALSVKRDLLLSKPGKISSRGTTRVTAGVDPLMNFRPKDDSDYRAKLVGRELIKTRRHESLVAEFAEHCRSRGFATTTPHPQDLVLRRSGFRFLVEAKVLYGGNATEAVRAAVGQLLTYAHFLYPPPAMRPEKVALFSEHIGWAYVEFLESLGMSSTWREDGRWFGSKSAQVHGLTDEPSGLATI